MITIYLLFRLFNIPLTNYTADLYCTKEHEELLPIGTSSEHLPSSLSIDKYITQRTAPRGLIPVSEEYMKSHAPYYYGIINPYEEAADGQEKTNRLIKYVFRKFLCRLCDDLEPFHAFRELLLVAAKNQKDSYFKHIYIRVKENGIFLQETRQMNQQQFGSDSALIKWIDEIENITSTPDYLDTAVHVIQQTYGNDIKLLQYEDQIFPDMLLYPSSNFETTGFESTLSIAELRNRINFPDFFFLQKPLSSLNKDERIIDERIIDESIIPTLLKNNVEKRIRSRPKKYTLYTKGYTRGDVSTNEQSEITHTAFSTCSYFNNMIFTTLLVWETAKSCKGEVCFIREKIMKIAGNEIASLLRSDLYSSMIGTQCVVLFPNTRFIDSYPDYYMNPNALWTLLIQRSNEVLENQGGYQFAGVGSFIIRGYHNTNVKQIEREFDIFSSLKCVFAEELFSAQDPNACFDTSGKKQMLMSMLMNGKAKVEFLGLSASLDTLKTDLVYLILIEDEQCCSLPFKSNFEDCPGGPCMIPLQEISTFLKGKEQIQAHSLVGPLELLKRSRLLKARDELMK